MFRSFYNGGGIRNSAGAVRRMGHDQILSSQNPLSGHTFIGDSYQSCQCSPHPTLPRRTVKYYHPAHR